MSVPVREYLRNRKDRAVGTIMGYLERQHFQDLSREEQLAVRQVVIDALNVYHESVLDLVKSDDAVRNEEVIDLLRRLDLHMANAQRSRRKAVGE